MTLYKDWIIQLSKEPTLTEYLDYLVEVRDGKQNPELKKGYIRNGIIGVPDKNADSLDTFMRQLGTSLQEQGYGSKARYLLQESFVIPCWSLDGQLRALVGYSDQRSKARKYYSVFPENVPIAAKMWGEQYTKAALTCGTLFVPEGILDAVRLATAGLPVMSTLGVSGHKLQPYQREVLSRFKRLVYIRDNDKVGLQGFYDFTKTFPNTVGEPVPLEKDPDAFASKHPVEFAAYIARLKQTYM